MPEWPAGFGAGLGSVKGGIGVLWPTPQAPLTGSRPAPYGNSLRHGDEKNRRGSPGWPRRDPRPQERFGKGHLGRRGQGPIDGLGKRRAMRVGAVLSTWVMELTVPTLVGLMARLFCLMASGFNSSAETFGTPHLHWKGFCFCFCGVVWRGAAHPPDAQRSGACPPVRAFRTLFRFSQIHRWKP